MSQSPIKFYRLLIVAKEANNYEPTIYNRIFLMAVIRNSANSGSNDRFGVKMRPFALFALFASLRYRFTTRSVRVPSGVVTASRYTPGGSVPRSSRCMVRPSHGSSSTSAPSGE